MIKWTLKEINLDLKYSWAISRGKSDSKKNFIVGCAADEIFGKGEIAPNSRFDEGPELIRDTFSEFVDYFSVSTRTCHSLDEFINILLEYSENSERDVPNSLMFGLEAAFVDFLSRKNQIPVADIIGSRSAQAVPTLYSVPLLGESELESFYRDHNLSRFTHLKCKVDNSLRSKENLRALLDLHSGKVGVDANEAFSNLGDLESFLREIPLERILFLEQPFPANLSHLSREIRQSWPQLLLMADESLSSGRVFDDMARDFHAVNVKLMKAGSLLRALKQIREARSLGMKVMIGCMVETSLGISYALQLAKEADWLDLDGFLYLKDDPYGAVFESEGKLFFGNSQ